jgi:hypothetical protein
MSIEITTSFVQQYRSNLELLAQQTMSRLAAAVTVEPVTGTTLWWDQIGSTTMQPLTTRHGDTPVADIPHRRRRIDLNSWNQAELLDTADKVRTLADPSSRYTQALAAARERQKDSIIATAAFATAYTGASGGTTVAFPAAQQVAVNSWKYGSGTGNAGLTISKIIEAAAILNANEVEEMDRYLAVSSKQLADMLATTEVTSKDYNTVQALATGQVSSFMGFNIIRSELLPIDGSSYRRCIAWQKKGIVMAASTGDMEMASIDKRPDKNNAWQAYVELNAGAARVEEARVVEIKCLES